MEASRQLQPIRALLEVDEENIEKCKQFLLQFDSRIYAVLEDTAIAYDDFEASLAADVNFKKPIFEELKAILEKAGITGQEFVKIMSDQARAKRLPEWQKAADKLGATDLRLLLVLDCHRQFMWAVTDLLKLRVTKALGCLRLQVEAAALLRLFLEDPSLAAEWSHIISDRHGKDFHKKTRRLIPQMLERLKLTHYYEIGSGGALHVRLMSLVVGGPVVMTERGTRKFRVNYQEFDGTKPFRFILSVVSFITAQSRIMNSLAESFPELNLESWTPRQMRLAVEVDRLWQRLREVFPSECAKNDARNAARA